MSDIATRSRRRAKDTASAAEDEGRAVTKGDGGDDDDVTSKGLTITGELKDTFREAAIEVLKPVMRKATTAAAKYAVKEGPSLVKDKLAPRLEDVGGAAGIAKGIARKWGLSRPLAAVKGTRKIAKKDMVHNALCPKIEVDPETYIVRADGVPLLCEPASVLPMAQRYFLF